MTVLEDENSPKIKVISLWTHKTPSSPRCWNFSHTISLCRLFPARHSLFSGIFIHNSCCIRGDSNPFSDERPHRMHKTSVTSGYIRCLGLGVAESGIAGSHGKSTSNWKPIFLHDNCYFPAFYFGKASRSGFPVRILYVPTGTFPWCHTIAPGCKPTAYPIPSFSIFILPSAIHKGHQSIPIQHPESSTVRGHAHQVRVTWITLYWIFHNPVATLQRKGLRFVGNLGSAEFEQRPRAKALESFNLSFPSYWEAAPGRSFYVHSSPYSLTHREISNTSGQARSSCAIFTQQRKSWTALFLSLCARLRSTAPTAGALFLLDAVLGMLLLWRRTMTTAPLTKRNIWLGGLQFERFSPLSLC